MNKLVKRRGFATTPNDILNDKELSLKAKGLYAYLESKPDNWSFSVERMSRQLKEGEGAITSGLKELEIKGLLKRKPIKKPDGTWGGCDYVLSDTPFLNNPETDNPLTDNPLTDNHPTLSNKDISNKDISNKDLIISSKPSLPDEVNILLKEFYNFNPHLNFGNKTERNYAQKLIDKYTLEKSVAMVQAYSQRIGEKYIPVATTPYQFWTKLPDIVIALKRQNEGNIVII